MNGEGSQLEEFSDKPDLSPSDDAQDQQPLVQLSATWSGPIPAPGDLKRYEDLLPGAADRILKMAEIAQENRHERASSELEIERSALEKDSKRSYLGIMAALLISLFCIGGGIYLISNGHEWAGTILVGIDLVGLVGVFIYGTNSSRIEERRRDADEE